MFFIAVPPDSDGESVLPERTVRLMSPPSLALKYSLRKFRRAYLTAKVRTVDIFAVYASMGRMLPYVPLNTYLRMPSFSIIAR